MSEDLISTSFFYDASVIYDHNRKTINARQGFVKGIFRGLAGAREERSAGHYYHQEAETKLKLNVNVKVFSSE